MAEDRLITFPTRGAGRGQAIADEFQLGSFMRPLIILR